MTLDIVRLRADTPGTAHVTHLNNAGAALMPASVLAAMQAHLTLESEIGGYEAADAASAAIARTYDECATLVGAAPANIAIVANATDGFQRTLATIDLKRGDRIVTTTADYTSYQIQYLALQQRLGVQVDYAQDLPEGGADPESVRALARQPNCKLVHVSWMPTHNGLVQDAAAIGRVCAELGVTYAIDACQAIGQLPIDVSSLHCDYLSVTARKFLRGPRGIGFLYVSPRALARGDYPLTIDMRGAEWVAPDAFAPAAGARRFEDWEFPYALVLGLGAAARYATEVGIAAASARALTLATRLRTALAQLPGARVLDRGKTKSALVLVAFEGREAAPLVTALREQRINVVSSLRWFGLRDRAFDGVTSAVRISPHYYNTEEECDQVVDALKALVTTRS